MDEINAHLWAFPFAEIAACMNCQALLILYIIIYILYNIYNNKEYIITINKNIYKEYNT